MQRSNIARVSAITLALITLTGCAGTTVLQEQTERREITIRATGEATTVADTVVIDAQVSDIAESTATATEAVALAMAAIRKALLSEGVTADGIKTETLQVNPEYRYYQEQQELVGYRAVQLVSVRVDEPAAAGRAIDAMIEAGGNSVRISSTTPVVREYTLVMSEARTAAVEAARAQAALYAAALGFELGDVVSLQELGSAAPPMPYAMRAGDVEQIGTVIDLGANKVSVSVEIRWTIN